MVIKEFYKTRNDGINLYKSCSDEQLKIKKIGTDEIYDEAIDVEDANFEYEEVKVKEGENLFEESME